MTTPTGARSARGAPGRAVESTGQLTGGSDRRARSCGCTAGAVAAAVVASGYLGYLWLSPGLSAAPFGWRSHLLTGAVLTLASAVTGKLGGILHSSWRGQRASPASPGPAARPAERQVPGP